MQSGKAFTRKPGSFSGNVKVPIASEKERKTENS
jgi:hypothetical protein